MLILIGQFSKMVRLSIKALRLYSERGLLPPAYIDPENGYRYYSPSQAKRAEIIRVLRSVDMALDEIREVLDAARPDMAKDQLLKHRRRMEERLRTQQRMLLYLEALIDSQERIVPYEITVISTTSQLVAGVRLHTEIATIKADVAVGFRKVMLGMGEFRCTPSGPPMLVYHDVIDDENGGDIEVCIPIHSAFAGRSGFECHELGGGNTATTVHHGPYEELSSAYHSLCAWILENDYEVAGPPREIYLNDPRAVNADKLQTRLEFPIEKRAEGQSVARGSAASAAEFDL